MFMLLRIAQNQTFDQTIDELFTAKLKLYCTPRSPGAIVKVHTMILYSFKIKIHPPIVAHRKIAAATKNY